jgi:hypothetical protein
MIYKNKYKKKNILIEIQKIKNYFIFILEFISKFSINKFFLFLFLEKLFILLLKIL